MDFPNKRRTENLLLLVAVKIIFISFSISSEQKEFNGVEQRSETRKVFLFASTGQIAFMENITPCFYAARSSAL